MGWRDPIPRELGTLPIEKIKVDARSRDDIPALLTGLQVIHADSALRTELFDFFVADLKGGDGDQRGRPTMQIWRVLVLGVVRQGLLCDYDRLQELANHHRVIRAFLGHGPGETDKRRYSLTTITRNVGFVSPKVLRKVYDLLQSTGHGVVRKRAWTNVARASLPGTARRKR